MHLVRVSVGTREGQGFLEGFLEGGGHRRPLEGA